MPDRSATRTSAACTTSRRSTATISYRWSTWTARTWRRCSGASAVCPRTRGSRWRGSWLRGLAAAHDLGVVHRDLKPGNVMVDGRGRVRIADFGLAAAVETVDAHDFAGTPAYMAPEQFVGRPASVSSDIYALGLVLYELFTGKAAFSGTTVADLARQHREHTPSGMGTIIGDLDPAVERAISRCLEKDPEARPASALAVAASL
ncbi:MAG: serine/threonine protein kinase, partial [Acidobacteria bacterium]